jgi:hypothetical protein
MNMPRFTAEASLYQTKEQYWTGRHAFNLRTQMIGPISPAVTKEECWSAGGSPWQDDAGNWNCDTEVINVSACGPGEVPLGEPPNIACVPDPRLTTDGGTGSPGGPMGGGRGGGKGKPKPKLAPGPPGGHLCGAAEKPDNPQALHDCIDRTSVGNPYYLWCGPENKLWCCTPSKTLGYVCDLVGTFHGQGPKGSPKGAPPADSQ